MNEWNEEYSAVINNTYSQAEIDGLAAVAEQEIFNYEVKKVKEALDLACDNLAGITDIYVVAAALERISQEYDEMAAGDEDEA